MKPILRKVSVHGGHSFSVREDILPYLYNHWHYHPEAELTLIRRGRGTRLVGDHMERFTDGDLVLLGPNLPHMWRNDADYFQAGSQLQVEAVAIHFHEHCWGAAFLQLPEMEPVRRLLQQARRGIRISGSAARRLARQMEQMLQASGPQKITGLVELLAAIAATPEKSLLSSLGFVQEYSLQRTDKINEIYHYTFNNFTNPIQIATVAKAVHISPHSFCRYFKTRTSRTYFQFLSELRIGYACKLILENEMSIAQVCYSSGFNNLANFNRQFKAITGKTPLQYFKEYAGQTAALPA